MTEWSQLISKAIQYNSHPSLCLNHWFWRSWIWMVQWRTGKPSRTNTPPKKCLFHLRKLQCKCRNSNTLSNSKFGLGIQTGQGAKVQNEAGQSLTKFFQENTSHSKHHLETTLEVVLHMVSNEFKLIIFFAAKNGEAL